MKLLIFLGLIISTSCIANDRFDTVKYDEKRRLFCELKYQNPTASDSLSIGSIQKGWLRKIKNGYHSIEIDGWVIMTNNSDNVMDDGNELYIEDVSGVGKLNRRTGIVKLNFKGNHNGTPYNKYIKWRCKLGENQF